MYEEAETIVVKVHILAITNKTARVVLTHDYLRRGDGGLSSRLAHSGLRAIDEYRIKAAREAYRVTIGSAGPCCSLCRAAALPSAT